MKNDPKQCTNLFSRPKYAEIAGEPKRKLKAKLAEVRRNDLRKE